jgi:MerR family copper efflux transcriptional regulator
MRSQPLNIGQAADASGLSVKMIRHYEEIGLLPTVRRTHSGYRMYGENEVHMLKFIRHARNLGFSMKQIEALLGLWRDTRRPSSKVKALAQDHIADLERKIQELESMRATLKRLVTSCHGDDRPDCPILEELALERSDAQPAATKPKKGKARHDCH